MRPPNLATILAAAARAASASRALPLFPLVAGLSVAAGGLGSLGCGATYYAVEVSSAASRVEEARTVHAAELAPYPYYYAREHLHQAQVEAADAHYSDAARYAEEAEHYAAIAIAATTHTGSGDKSEAGDGADSAGENDSGHDATKQDSKATKSGKSTDSTNDDSDAIP